MTALRALTALFVVVLVASIIGLLDALVLFVAVSVLVLVALWVASVRQASLFGRHVDGVLAELAADRQSTITATAPAPAVGVVTPLRVPTPPPSVVARGDVVFGTVVPNRELPPAQPRMLTNSTSSGHQATTSDHHDTNSEAQMATYASAQSTVARQGDAFELRWELANLTSFVEKFSRDFASSPYATAAGSERVRRAMSHLAQAVGELDSLSEGLDVAIGPGRGGAR